MADSSTEVTNASAFQKRSLGKQILFSVITLGLYGLYWWHVTNKQLNEGTDSDFNPTLRTIGLFIPIYNIVVMWRTSHDSEAVTDNGGVILFLLFLVFAPAAWYLIQSGINKTAAGPA